MKTILFAACAALCAANISAQNSYFYSFGDATLPDDVPTLNIDGGKIKTSDYRAALKDDVAWYRIRMPNSGGVGACPTRNADGSTRRSRIVFPAVQIDSDEAMLRWDARRLLSWAPEAYNVLVKAEGDAEFTTLLSIENEDYEWETHYYSLIEYKGSSVQIAFETASESADSYMLLIDNVAIGNITDIKFARHSSQRHYFCTLDGDDEIEIERYYKNFGANGSSFSVKTTHNGAPAENFTLSDMANLEEVSMPMTFSLNDGEYVDYREEVTDSNNKRVSLTDDFVMRAPYRRTLLLDHFMGMWCPNCPAAMLEVEQLKAQYGDEIIIIENHVRDDLTCEEYWEGFGSTCIFAIPGNVWNHNVNTVTNIAGTGEAIHQELRENTFAKVSAEVAFNNDGTATINSESTFAINFNNSNDLLRVGYLLLADVHDPSNKLIYQLNSSNDYSSAEYFVLPEYMPSQDIYFHNTPIEGSTAVNGAPQSLSGQIVSGEPKSHSITLTVPEKFRKYPLRAVAMIIDNLSGRVLNCCYATPVTPGAVSSVEADRQADNRICDLMGRIMPENATLAPGIYIKGGKKIYLK